MIYEVKRISNGAIVGVYSSRDLALEVQKALNRATDHVYDVQERESFSDEDIKKAIQSFLDYGESSYKEHTGYFSGSGWAARVLRFHLEQL